MLLVHCITMLAVRSSGLMRYNTSSEKESKRPTAETRNSLEKELSPSRPAASRMSFSWRVSQT